MGSRYASDASSFVSLRLIVGRARRIECLSVSGVDVAGELERARRADLDQEQHYGAVSGNHGVGELGEMLCPAFGYGIGKFSDKEIARTLRHGVGTDGRAVLDFMPFYDISDEDLTAIISYLRSTKPVKNEVPKHEFNFIGKAVKAFLIKPMGDGDAPARVTPDTTAAYGKYLSASVANCRGCHTTESFRQLKVLP